MHLFLRAGRHSLSVTVKVIYILAGKRGKNNNNNRERAIKMIATLFGEEREIYLEEAKENRIITGCTLAAEQQVEEC